MRHVRTILRSRGLFLLALALVASLVPQVAAALPVFAVGNTLAQLDQALQITYAEPFVNQVIQDSDFLDLIEQDPNVKEDDSGAKYVETSHYNKQAGSVGWRLEDEYLTESLPAEFLNSRIYLKKATLFLEMTGDTMRRMRKGNGSWVDFADQALEDLASKTRDSMDRSALLYGWNIRAQVQAVPVLVTTGVYDIAIKNWGGISGAANPWLLFAENDSLTFASSLGPPVVLRSSGGVYKAVVNDVNDDAATPVIRVAMTAGLAATLQVNDYIGEGDNRGNGFPAGSPAVEREMMGLMGHVDDGTYISTYFNVARANYRRFRCIDVDCSTKGSADSRFTEDTIDYGDAIASQKARANINAIVCSTEHNTQYWNSLKTDRTINDPRKYTGGKGKGLTIMLGDREVTLRVIRKLTSSLAFGLDTSTFHLYSGGPLQWDNGTGSLWNRVVDSTGPKDRFFATGFLYRQMWNHFVRKNVRFKNLTG